MLNLSRDAFTAHSCIRRLRVELLEPEKKDLDLIEILDGPDGFEQRLQDRRSILTEAEAKQNATAESVTAALLEELRKIRASGKSAVHADSSGAPGTTGPVDESRLEAVLTGSESAAFRKLVTTLDSLDTGSPQGQRDALTAGFDGKCVAAVRVLLSTSENGDLTLSRRHVKLGLLNELRQYRGAYFDYHLRAGGDATVTSRMQRYTVASMIEGGDRSVLEGWLRLEIDTTDFIKAPHGAMGRLQHQMGWSTPIVHEPVDYYCQPALVTKFCEFMHLLAVATGMAAESTSGYTFVTLGVWYNSHLEKALGCSDMTGVLLESESS